MDLSRACLYIGFYGWESTLDLRSSSRLPTPKQVLCVTDVQADSEVQQGASFNRDL